VWEGKKGGESWGGREGEIGETTWGKKGERSRRKIEEREKEKGWLWNSWGKEAGERGEGGEREQSRRNKYSWRGTN